MLPLGLVKAVCLTFGLLVALDALVAVVGWSADQQYSSATSADYGCSAESTSGVTHGGCATVGLAGAPAVAMSGEAGILSASMAAEVVSCRAEDPYHAAKGGCSPSTLARAALRSLAAAYCGGEPDQALPSAGTDQCAAIADP